MMRNFVFVPPFYRNCPVSLPSILDPEAVDTIQHHFEASNFVISGDKISVLNSPSNADSK